MTLTDAGPLIAIIDADELDHERCLEVLRLYRGKIRALDPASPADGTPCEPGPWLGRANKTAR